MVGDDMSKADIVKNFRITEEMDTFLGRVVTSLDCSLSEFIRASILLAAPQIMANPHFLKSVTLETMSVGNILVRQG